VPYSDPSWRQWPQWLWLSRTLCVFGIHHWTKSKTLQDLPIACTICPKKTKHFKTYMKLAKKNAGL